MRQTKTTILATLLACCLPVAAQGKDGKDGKDAKAETKRLEQLLQELQGTGLAAWQARLDALESEAKAHDARAANLQKQAAAESAQAKALRDRIERFKKVMALLAPAPAPKTPPAAAQSKPAQPKPAAAPAKQPAAATPMKSTGDPAQPKPAQPKPAQPKPAQPKPATTTPAKAAPAKTTPPKAAPPKAPPGKAAPKTAPGESMTAKAPAGKSAGKPAGTSGKSKAAAPAAKKPAAAQPPAAAAVDAPAGEYVTYDDHVQTIFMDNCSACHDPAEKEGGLDLTTFATARAGGSSGTTIVPGDLDRSRLFQLVAHLQTPTMPPDEPPIARKHIEVIRRWILGGAPESKADAAAFALQKKAEAPKPVVLRPRFDGPAPMPKAWAAVPVRVGNRPAAVKTLAASGRSNLLAIPGNRQVFVLDGATHQVLGILPFAHGDVEVLRFSADGSRLLVAGGTPGSRGRAVLYDVVSGGVSGTFGKEADAVIAAAVHPQLSRVALGGSNRRVRVFDTGTGAMLYEIAEHNEWILGVDFSSDGKFLVSVDRAGAVVLSEAASGRNVDTIRVHRGAVNAVRFAPDGGSYATVGEDRTLRLFAVKGARQLTQRSTSSPATSVAFSADGKLIAVGCRNGRALTFRGDGSQIATLADVGDWVYSVAFDAPGTKLFVGDWRGTTSVFELNTRRRTAELVPSQPNSQ